MNSRVLWILTIIEMVIILEVHSKGILYPKDSQTRETRLLDGIWNFVAPESDVQISFKNRWDKYDIKQASSIIPMPVPSSYNDVTQESSLRDHVGVVLYNRDFYIPNSWNNTKVWLRFSSVHYAAEVIINGISVMNHQIGHLPFADEITDYLNYGSKNSITVICDNILTDTTIPQGNLVNVTTDDGIKTIQDYSFDFFNYAGIHRSVFLYTTPNIYIDDIDINTSIDGSTGYVEYNINYVRCDNCGNVENIMCHVRLLDEDETVVGEGSECQQTLSISDANFWWPYLMHNNPGYLYTLEVQLITNLMEITDVYSLKIGIREITWSNTQMFINGKPIYFTGFGRHEDSDFRGKGLDLVLATKDYNLIKWIGANSYRTSHYPYADELYDMADEQGIMIIDECPSVNTDIYSASLLENHKTSLTELIVRDKNHPSVIMWSIANEPRTHKLESDNYFGSIAEHVKSLDRSRPITLAFITTYNEDQAGKHLDILSFNRYYGWYDNAGSLDMITNRVITEAKAWNEKYNKPVIMSEYGADTMPGLHVNPTYIWSEEYQVELMSKHFRAFDELRKNTNFFIGEHIWNFADFKTKQEIRRVDGNKKGIFTRNRQPKASAHHLRKRYHLLAQEIEGVTPPEDLLQYVVNITLFCNKDEL